MFFSYAKIRSCYEKITKQIWILEYMRLNEKLFRQSHVWHKCKTEGTLNAGLLIDSIANQSIKFTTLPNSRSFACIYYNNQIPQNFSLISKWKFHSSDPFFLPFKFHFDFIFHSFSFLLKITSVMIATATNTKTIARTNTNTQLREGPLKFTLAMMAITLLIIRRVQASLAGCWYGITE